MAVKIKNESNIRKAKRWNEKDDAALAELLRKKIKEVDLSIKEAPSPFMRSKLRAKKAHYKTMSAKVANGTYNGDIIFSEMQAAAALRTQDTLNYQRYSNPGEARKYVNSYQDMDFDYESYFRKTRYYGRFLPILATLFTLILLAFFLIGAFIPAGTKQTLNDAGLKVDTLFYFKLGPNELDYSIKNDGKWPDGDWRYVNGEEQVLAQGQPYIAPGETEPKDYVYLYSDLGLRTINISSFDIIKAWFRTKMLSKVRLDFIEDSSYFQGSSWFYAKYMESAEANIPNYRNSDGDYDFPIIIKYLAGYGTILSLIAAFLLGIICLVLNIIRIFTYTTRRLHGLNFLLLFFCILVAMLPLLLAMEGTDIKSALGAFFTLDAIEFLENPEKTTVFNIFAVIPAGIALVMLFLPKLFKNRFKKRPSFVPKGNRPRNVPSKEQSMQQLAYDNVRRAYRAGAKR